MTGFLEEIQGMVLMHKEPGTQQERERLEAADRFLLALENECEEWAGSRGIATAVQAIRSAVGKGHTIAEVAVFELERSREAEFKATHLSKNLKEKDERLRLKLVTRKKDWVWKNVIEVSWKK